MPKPPFPIPQPPKYEDFGMVAAREELNARDDHSSMIGSTDGVRPGCRDLYEFKTPNKPEPFRNHILTTAQKLMSGDRAKDYGDAWDLHVDIAKRWSLELGIDIDPAKVARMMVQLKLARLNNMPHHVDSSIDGAAYMALAAEFAERQKRSE